MAMRQQHVRTTLVLVGLIGFVLLGSNPAVGADWPTFRHDACRTGITDAQLSSPLVEAWVHQATHPPRPAWPPPAERDFCHSLLRLSSSTVFDRAHHVAVADSRAYYGSSADDAVYCLDAATGAVDWSFTTNGPVRLAPTVAGGRVYAGSDDGHVYCLDATTGTLVWDCMACPEERLLPGNGRMISLWPVRSGVVVDDGVAYFAAGLFPSRGVYLIALDAGTGDELWRKSVDVSCQGYLLASPSRLFLPTGRTAPASFDRADGAGLGQIDGFDKRDVGGCFALVLNDMVVHGPSESGNIHISEPESQEKIASSPGIQMVACGSMAYILTEDDLTAIDRGRYLELGKEIRTIERVKSSERTEEQEQRLIELKEARTDCERWRVPCESACSLIMAGDALVVGANGRASTYDAGTGELVWTGEVSGKAYGLAVADDALFVSTDTGQIHCFRSQGTTPLEPSAPKAQSVDADPYPEDEWTPLYAETARRIIDETGIRQGYCLVLDCGIGRLAHELAKRTSLTIVGIEDDPAEVAEARRALRSAGLYGTRVTVHQGFSTDLPFPSYFANLVVSDGAMATGRLPESPQAVSRILRPFGGVVWLGQPDGLPDSVERLKQSALEGWMKSMPVTQRKRGLYQASESPSETGLSLAFAAEADYRIDTTGGVWGVVQRGALPGSGEWTHQYADPANSACSGDTLTNGPMDVQWFGRPGPRSMVDRHIRTVAPLAKDGRLFIPADNRIIAVDAYNGAPLWERTLPYSRRVAVHLDCGNLALADDRLYIAAAHACLALDVLTGETVRTFDAPQHYPGELDYWGYLAVTGDRLVGTGARQDAPRAKVGHQADSESRYGDPKLSVTSDYVFALDRDSGKEAWHYKNGVIWNPCVAIHGSADPVVYFLESRLPGTLEAPSSRLGPPMLTGNDACYLVALDLETGEPLWERAVDVSKCTHVVYLSVGNESIIVTGSGLKEGDENAWYYLYAFSTRDGAPLWNANHRNNKRGRIDHGKDVHHPAIVGDAVFAEPFAYDLQTGIRRAGLEFPRGGHSCGTISASSDSLFYRGNNPQAFDIASAVRTPLNEVSRPGCWINIVPAGGIVAIPEASSGCVCAYPIQTSMAFAPRKAPE
jgi:outer membrane protein assembly factor BamB